MIKVRASQVFTHSAEDSVSAKKLLDAGTPFPEVVEQYSVCPSKKNGGDLGWMPEGTLQSLMGQTVSEADKGKLIGPVHSQYGYHILVISEIEVERVPGPFQSSTSMHEAEKLFPQVHNLLFQKYHVGLPIKGYQPDDTIGSVCAAQDKPEAELLNFLNTEYSDKNIPIISPEEVKEKMQSGDARLTLLDIRESWEWDMAKIEGSQFISKDNFESVLNSLEKDKELVLVDWRQDRSPSFLKFLSQHGFTNVKCLAGGIDAWATRISPPIPRYSIDEDDGYRYEDLVQEDDHS